MMKRDIFAKPLSLLLAAGFLVTLGGIAATPHADAATLASGKDNNLKWSITTKGHLTVTGTGDWGDNHPERKIKVTETDEEWIDDEDGGYWKEYTRVDYEYEDAELQSSKPEWLEYADYIKSATIKASGMSSLYDMFRGCENLKKVNLKGLNTSKVQSTRDMFDMCYELKKIDLSKQDFSKVADMSFMFSQCSELTAVKWPSAMPKGPDTECLFYGCDSLEKVDLSKFKFSSSSRLIGSNGIFDTYNRVSTLTMPAHAPSMVLPPKYYSLKKGMVKLKWKNAARKTVYATKANTSKPKTYKRNPVKVDGKKQSIKVKAKATIRRGKSKTLKVKGAKGDLYCETKDGGRWIDNYVGAKYKKGIYLKKTKKGNLKIKISKKAKKGQHKIKIYADSTPKYQSSPTKTITITIK